MDQNTRLIGTGSVGAIVPAVCCITPLLAILLGALGLSAYVAKLDYGLIPVFFASVGLVIFALIRRKRNCLANTSR